MTLIDAGFIIELFIRYYDLCNCVETGISFLKPSVAEDVSHDLILLENQLPFFVLEDLFNLAIADVDKNLPAFPELIFNYFAALNQQNLQPNCVNSVLHFTDLLRIFYISQRVKSLRRFQLGNILNHRNSASELVKAGLKLKVDETKKSLLELRYHRGSLTMSHLDLSDETEFDRLSNMVAFEQMHYPYEACITDYLKILDFLVYNGDDVDLLVRRGTITSFKDNNEVSGMIKHLCSNLVQTDVNERYLYVYMKLVHFPDDPVHKWKAYLKTISVAAVVILILTVVQTFCSVISLFKSRHEGY